MNTSDQSESLCTASIFLSQSSQNPIEKKSNLLKRIHLWLRVVDSEGAIRKHESNSQGEIFLSQTYWTKHLMLDIYNGDRAPQTRLITLARTAKCFNCPKTNFSK